MPADKYSSLAALKEQLGTDVFRKRVCDRRSDITIIAPHGGFIEAGTSAIAKAIAGRRYNLFDFQGLQRENPLDLHVTATNFRDRQLSALLDKSTAAVSIHGMGAQRHKDIWLGGLNRELKGMVLEQLRKRGFDVNPDSPMYRGESPRNVVNLARNQGVQLELSDELLAELFVETRFTTGGRCPKTTTRFADLVAAVRDAIGIYRKS
jgi:phage replication-related protein YjqB (UPF0714/DUF867 family)